MAVQPGQQHRRMGISVCCVPGILVWMQATNGTHTQPRSLQARHMPAVTETQGVKGGGMRVWGYLISPQHMFFHDLGLRHCRCYAEDLRVQADEGGRSHLLLSWAQHTQPTHWWQSSRKRAALLTSCLPACNRTYLLSCCAWASLAQWGNFLTVLTNLHTKTCMPQPW
jgi:hypothetical protein